MATVIVEVGGKYQKFSFSDLAGHSGLSIGRAFSNDIITPDPYVEANQLEIRLSTDEQSHWAVSNKNSTNPILVNNKTITSPNFNLASGDQLTIGRTQLRFYTEDHAMPDARQFSFTNWAHNQKLKPLYSCIMLSILFGVMLWTNYLETPVEIEWGKLAATAAFPVGISLVWASLWSLTGRFQKSEHSFFSQLFFTAFCFSLLILAGNIYGYVDYMFSSVVAGEIVDWLLSALIFGLLIGFNLALLTYSPSVFKQGLISSAALFFVIYLLMYLNKNDYDNTPTHTSSIKPAYVPTSFPKHIDGHIEGYGQLFERLSSPD
ncbi:MAG: FHA domain-containing protein [Porticoccaceae bacterium]|nr:FHA domain-containing protein [Porticoccaceae bacterium]